MANGGKFVATSAFECNKGEASFDEGADAGLEDEADAVFEDDEFLGDNHFAAAAAENSRAKNRDYAKSDPDEEKEVTDAIYNDHKISKQDTFVKAFSVSEIMADIRSGKEKTVGLNKVTPIERWNTTKVTSLQKEGLDAIPDEKFLE